MDLSFTTAEGKFNYRVCALLLQEGKILAMQDERSPSIITCREAECRWGKRRSKP